MFKKAWWSKHSLLKLNYYHIEILSSKFLSARDRFHHYFRDKSVLYLEEEEEVLDPERITQKMSGA